jgi:hypothetical protein
MSSLEKVYVNKIPIDKYQAFVKNGEESGLLIELKGDKYLAFINFGAVSAMRMLDEGIILNELFNQSDLEAHLKDDVSNTIYMVNGGEFGDLLKSVSNELYEYLDLKHYVIFTMNYVIEVISKWEPSIEIVG